MDFGRRAVAGFISGGEQLSLRLARGRWWRTRTGGGGRQASLCKHVVLVVEMQLVIHLQTWRQETDIRFIMDGGAPNSSPVQEYWDQERVCQGETKVLGKAHPRWGEGADCSQCGVGKGEPPGEVGPRVKGGSENKAQPLQAGLWIEKLILKCHREVARPVIAPGGCPMDQFDLWNGKRDVDWGGLSLE